MRRARGIFPASIRARSAVAAAAATALVFGAGSWWLRDDTRDRWERDALQKATENAFAVTSALESGKRPGPEFLDQPAGPFTVVFEDGTQAMSDWPFADEETGRPLVPLPPAKSWTVRHVRFPRELWDNTADSTTRTENVLSHRDATFAVGVTDVLPTDRIRTVTEIGGKRPQRLTVYVLAPQEAADAAVAALDRFVVWGLPVAVVFVGAVAWLVTGRALRPVDAIRTKMDEIGARAVDRRVPVPTGSVEIALLARATNQTLDRLESALVRQRRFVADASHELRSPLAGLRSSLEIPLVHPEGVDWQAVVSEALADTVRLQRLADDLLLLASDAREPLDEATDLADLAEEQVAERACATTAEEPAFVASTGGPAVVAGSEIRLGRVLRNLIDNAARHARTEVRVTVESAAETVTLTVADDGPGVPPADRERIFDRFVRLDDARARSTGGTGLGLTIVRDIVTGLGGTVHAEDGARFVVRLPRRNDDEAGPGHRG
jgi:signal transduction histidine kinase